MLWYMLVCIWIAYGPSHMGPAFHCKAFMGQELAPKSWATFPFHLFLTLALSSSLKGGQIFFPEYRKCPETNAYRKQKSEVTEIELLFSVKPFYMWNPACLDWEKLSLAQLPCRREFNHLWKGREQQQEQRGQVTTITNWDYLTLLSCEVGVLKAADGAHTENVLFSLESENNTNLACVHPRIAGNHCRNISWI